MIQVLPVATLLSVLFSLGELSKRNEITSIKAAGVNLWKIIFLFLFAGLAIGAADLAAREFVIPKTTRLNERIKKEKIQKETISYKTEFSNLIVSLKNNSRVTVGFLDTKAQIMKNVVIEKYDENFYLEYLVLASDGKWNGQIWELENGALRKFKDGFWDEMYFKTYDSSIELKPEDLAFRKMKSETMSSKEFKRYIRQIRIFGQTALSERINLNLRYSSVFCHLIVMMIGIPFALGFGNKLGKILSFTLALTASFTYWGFQAITQSLGENAIRSPLMAAWLPNFVFIAIGIFMLAKVKK
jgi:lipopolysaccharide export system permease protein